MKKWILCSLTGTFLALGADDWPQFRGPGGMGLGSETATLPTEFGPGEAQLWKTELPLGQGSPCVWGDRIFVTGFDPAVKKIEIIALDRKKGAIVWRRTVPATEIEKVHEISSPATSTPVTDGKLIYAYIGSYGLLAYAWDGTPVWEYPMGAAKSPYGSGTSPILVRDLVIVTRDYLPDPQMVAVGKNDGKLAWKANLTKSTQPGSGAAHATPALWRDQIILHRPAEVSAYASKDGSKLWWVNTNSSGTSTASIGDGVVYVTAFSVSGDGTVPRPPFSEVLEKYDANKDGKLSESELPARDLYLMKRAGVPDTIPGAQPFTLKFFFRRLDLNNDGFIDESEYNRADEFVRRMSTSAAGGLLSIRAGGEGDVSATAVEWAEKRNVPEVTAPLTYRGRVYMVTSGGIVSCVNAKTGRSIYRGRVNAPGTYFASPVAAGGKVFVTSAEGIITVLGGGETLEILANNDLGEAIYGTPALAESTIYVRSSQHLWAFGQQ